MEINITSDFRLQYYRAIAKKESRTLSIEDFNNQISQFGALALNENDICLALEIYKKLNNRKKVKKIAELAYIKIKYMVLLEKVMNI